MPLSESEIQGAMYGAKLGFAAIYLTTLFGAAVWATNNTDNLEAACASPTPIVNDIACVALDGAKATEKMTQSLQSLTARLK